MRHGHGLPLVQAVVLVHLFRVLLRAPAERPAPDGRHDDQAANLRGVQVQPHGGALPDLGPVPGSHQRLQAVHVLRGGPRPPELRPLRADRFRGRAPLYRPAAPRPRLPRVQGPQGGWGGVRPGVGGEKGADEPLRRVSRLSEEFLSVLCECFVGSLNWEEVKCQSRRQVKCLAVFIFLFQFCFVFVLNKSLNQIVFFFVMILFSSFIKLKS